MVYALMAIRAAGAWRLEPMRGELEKRLRTESEAILLRQAAIDALVRLGGPSSVELIDTMATAGDSASIRSAAVVGLAALDLERAAKRAVELLAPGLSSANAVDVFGALLARKNGPEALRTALADRPLPRDIAKLGVRMAQAAGQPNPALIEALTKAGSLNAPVPLPDPAELARLVADVNTSGHPDRGETLFRRADLQCVKCHAIAGAGGKIGPGLESIGASAQVDYLIDSLLQPSKAVKEGYHSIVVATKDGRILTGIVLRRDEKGLVLRDADGHELAVAADQIDEEQPGPSLMPVGLTESLTREELIDLVRFLSELGKPGPYAVAPGRVVRNWETLPGTPETARAIKRIGFDATARGVQPTDAVPIVWQPLFSQVSGALPVAEIPLQPDLDASPARRWVQFGLDVSTGGSVVFKDRVIGKQYPIPR